jgi:hypothetical protein
MCDEQAVRIIVEEGPGDIERMLALGARFDTDSEGRLLTAQEGGHGMRRILRAGGDATGQEMVRALKETISRKPCVAVRENAFVADVLTEGGRVSGLLAWERGGWVCYRTRHVIIASGGVGQIYRYTTNPSVATGDGIAMALRAGACSRDMEFVHFTRRACILPPTGTVSASSSPRRPRRGRRPVQRRRAAVHGGGPPAQGAGAPDIVPGRSTGRLRIRRPRTFCWTSPTTAGNFYRGVSLPSTPSAWKAASISPFSPFPWGRCSTT